MITETQINLLKEVGLPVQEGHFWLNELASNESKYIKDLKINVSNALNSASLTKKEIFLIALAVAINEKHTSLQHSFQELAQVNGANHAEISEVSACVSMMNVNNVFYRFRHFMHKDIYDQTPAGIKMSVMLNPVLGKATFELISLVISAINGCELCVKSHEESVLKHGLTTTQVFEAIRLGAVLKGLISILD
jgi:alkyl hydroperoxide reductase subunit D